MSKIVTDAEGSAKWIADAMMRSGYRADFSPASLSEIDRFIDEHSQRGEPRPGGLLSRDLGGRIFALGAYVGEVIRQALGGIWVGNDADPRAEINVEVRLNDGTRFWPVQRVMKRFKGGPSESIIVYGRALGLPPTS